CFATTYQHTRICVETSANHSSFLTRDIDFAHVFDRQKRGGDCAQAENNIANPAQPFAPHQSETPHPQPPRGSHARHAAETSLIVLNSCGRASFQTTT